MTLMNDRLCWHCRTPQNISMPVGIPLEGGEPEQRLPQDGDLALCFGCGEWNVFTDDASAMRQPTDDEYIEIAKSDEATIARNGWITAERARKEGREVGQAYLVELIKRLGEERVFNYLFAQGWREPNVFPPLYMWNNAVVELMLEDERKAAHDRTR